VTRQTQEVVHTMGHKAIRYKYPNAGIDAMIMAEREKKRCEPEEPPAALESCAKHTAGGLVRRQCLFLCSVGKTSQDA